MGVRAGILKFTGFPEQNERGQIAFAFMEPWYEVGFRASS